MVSSVMRDVANRRWRGQVPARLARQLLERLDELPADERQRLVEALARQDRS